MREYGRIDVLFNNAAMAYFNWLEDITNEEWNRDLREEIDLVFFLTRAAWPYLKASHGVVVNTAGCRTNNAQRKWQNARRKT